MAQAILRRSTSTLKKVCRKTSPDELRTTFRSITGTVTVLVGPTEVRRLIPKELLTAVSPFFEAALNGAFAEGLSQTVKLPEDRPDVFDYFLFWLYTRSLAHEAVDASDPVKPAYFHLLHLYCLVDKLGVEACKNAIIDKVAERAEATNSVPTPTDTWIIFELYALLPSNALRRLMVDLFAWKRTDNLVDTHDDEWHPRFMRDLCVRIKRTDIRDTNLAKPWLRDICQYHEHIGTVRCGGSVQATGGTAGPIDTMDVEGEDTGSTAYGAVARSLPEIAGMRGMLDWTSTA